MKPTLKIFLTFLVLSILLLIGGIGQTYRTRHSHFAEQFQMGSFPNPILNGFKKGSANFYTSSWQGKTFDANNESGINNFGTNQKYTFKTYKGKGLQDTDLNVLKIDYDNGQNPWWISPVLDELVQVAPGQYLGKIHYRLIPGLPFSLGYFKLEDPNQPDNTIRDITVSGRNFTIRLPQNWDVKFNDGKGLILREMIALSPDFKGHEEKTATSSLSYFETGAKLDIWIEKGPLKATEKPLGTILSSEKITLAGINTTLNTLTDPSVKLGQILDARLSYQGNSYIIRFAYNPEQTKKAKEILLQFLSSFTFVTAKK